MQIKSYVVLVYNYMLINIYFLISILKYVRIKLKNENNSFQNLFIKIKVQFRIWKKKIFKNLEYLYHRQLVSSRIFEVFETFS